MKKLLGIGLLLGLAACGGSGGSDGGREDPPDTSGFVSITPPDQDTAEPREFFTQISAGTYETELTTVRLNGGVSFLQSAECGDHPGFEVTVTNAATNEIVGASERVNCPLLIRSGGWQSGRLALLIGSNRITASGAGDTSTITIIRIAEPPTVMSTVPAAAAMDVTPSLAAVDVFFSEAVTRSSINSSSFILEDSSGTSVPGLARATTRTQTSIVYDMAEFIPSEALQFGTTYTARLTTEVADIHGNAMAEEFSWSFTTVADVIPPMRVAESPAADNSCAAPDDKIRVRFDKLLDPATITSSTFVVQDAAGTPVSGSITLVDYIATFTPATPLDAATTYTAHLNSGITDIAGNPLTPSTWSFDTQYAAEGSWTEFAIPDDLKFVGGNTAVWTGAEIIVWGGTDSITGSDDYWRYDPALDQWSIIASVGAPSKRHGHSATWTGAEMIIWGGRSQNIEFFNDGGRYDPATNSWTAMTTVNAPSARNGHTEVWTGSELIVWGGGRDQNAFTATGGRYNPTTDTWTAVSTINAPTARRDHHAVFDGQYMIVWSGEINDGGSGVNVSDGAVYDPVSDVWTPLPSQNAPDITKSTEIPDSVVLADNEMLVWSPFRESVFDPFTGFSSSSTISEVRRYDGVTEQWLSIVDACESLATPEAVWLNGRMLSWNEDFEEGYAYDEQRDVWHPITAFPGGPVGDAMLIAIGDSVIMWDRRSNDGVGYRSTF